MKREESAEPALGDGRPDGLATDGLATDGLATDGLATDGLTATRRRTALASPGDLAR
ncbi:MAG: hypothetical protein JKY65_23370 [Planctomycetes bacterium]|nr:hypothetical protein [Planctomycetota bacterium]